MTNIGRFSIGRFSIGTTAAVMTSMGLVAGLAFSPATKTATITGLLIVAIADNVADSFGIHVLKESEGASRREVNSSTFGNFAVRLAVALTFVAIVFFLPPTAALVVSSLWGMLVLGALSYAIAEHAGTSPVASIVRHLLIAVAVIVASWLVGRLIAGAGRL